MCFGFDSSSWILCGWLQSNPWNHRYSWSHWRLASSWPVSWHRPPLSLSELTAWHVCSGQHTSPATTAVHFSCTALCPLKAQYKWSHLVTFSFSMIKNKKSPFIWDLQITEPFHILHLIEFGAAQPWKAGRATLICDTTMYRSFQDFRNPKAFLQRVVLGSCCLHCVHLLRS